MSTTLREFLRQQAEKYQAEFGDRKGIIEEWRAAIDRLFVQFRTWLQEADPQGIIEIEESNQEVREPRLGRHTVPRLNLRAFGMWVGIIPKARYTVGTAKPPQKSAPERALGRVDVTDEIRRYILYRFAEGSQDVWMIDDLRTGPKVLDQEAFERALMSYFQ